MVRSLRKIRNHCVVTMNQRISFRVHGEVQGVNFRNFTRRQAQTHGITGWVRNTPQSKVEGEAQGDEEGIKKFLKDIDKGPTHAHVVKLEKTDLDVKQGETGFEIRH